MRDVGQLPTYVPRWLTRGHFTPKRKSLGLKNQRPKPSRRDYENRVTYSSSLHVLVLFGGNFNTLKPSKDTPWRVLVCLSLAQKVLGPCGGVQFFFIFSLGFLGSCF